MLWWHMPDKRFCLNYVGIHSQLTLGTKCSQIYNNLQTFLIPTFILFVCLYLLLFVLWGSAQACQSAQVEAERQPWESVLALLHMGSGYQGLKPSC